MIRPESSARRILVMGGPGSGKSTLARRIGSMRGLPVLHLDAAYHGRGWVPRPGDRFLDEVAAFAHRAEWVIDGNYVSAATERFALADLIVLLDVPRTVRLARILKRIARHHGRVRIDSAPGCPERFDLAFLRYGWTWDAAVRPSVEAALRNWAGKLVRVRDGRAIDPTL